MSQPRIFIDEGAYSASAICKSTGNKFHLRMDNNLQGRIAIYIDGMDAPIDIWNLSRDEMKTLFRILSKPYKSK